MLQDPNHPDIYSGYVAPSAASLSDTVRTRLKAIDEADAKQPKDQNGLPARRYWLWTEYSKASDVVELPAPERVLAVKVDPKKPTKIKNVDVQMTEPTAEAYAVVFDAAKIADVPALNDKVVRGAVLNFTPPDKTTKVIHPVTKEVVDLEKYSLNTDLLVADLMGGETMKAINTTMTPQPLTALGELLVVDSQGKLHVQNEAKDVEIVRRLTVPKPDPKAAQQQATAGTEGLMPGGEGAPARGRAARRTPGCF